MPTYRCVCVRLYFSSVFLLGLPLMNHCSNECIKHPVSHPKHILYQEGLKLLEEMAYSMSRGREINVKPAVFFFHFYKVPRYPKKDGKGTWASVL